MIARLAPSRVYAGHNGVVEVIAWRAFAPRIDAGEEIHLLSGHDFEKPLASRAAGTLAIKDGDNALAFEATISADKTWARDFLAAHEAGLIRGLSPGFRIAATPDAEEVRSVGGVLRRMVRAAELFELSAVTRPAYPQAQIEARSWSLVCEAPDAGLRRAIERRRA